MMAFPPATNVEAANLGVDEEVLSYQGFNTVVGPDMNNNLAKQAEIVMTATKDKRDAFRVLNRDRTPYPGRSGQMFPLPGTAVFTRTGSRGVSSILNGLTARTGLAHMTNEDIIRALSAQITPIGLVRNPEVPLNGQLDPLMAVVIGGATNAYLPPGTKPYQLLVFGLPDAGTEIRTLNGSNTVHAAMVPRPVGKVHSAMLRHEIHRVAASKPDPSAFYYKTFGGMAPHLESEARADFEFAFAAGLAMIQTLNDMSVGLTAINPRDDAEAIARITQPMNVSGDVLPSGAYSVNTIMDNIHSMFGNPDAKSREARAFRARFNQLLRGVPSKSLFAGVGESSMASPPGQGSPRVERIRAMMSASQNLYQQRMVFAANWTKTAKLWSLTAAGRDGFGSAMIVH
jgi:hypothetical protein